MVPRPRGGFTALPTSPRFHSGRSSPVTGQPGKQPASRSTNKQISPAEQTRTSPALSSTRSSPRRMSNRNPAARAGLTRGFGRAQHRGHHQPTGNRRVDLRDDRQPHPRFDRCRARLHHHGKDADQCLSRKGSQFLREMRGGLVSSDSSSRPAAAPYVALRPEGRSTALGGGQSTPVRDRFYPSISADDRAEQAAEGAMKAAKRGE